MSRKESQTNLIKKSIKLLESLYGETFEKGDSIKKISLIAKKIAKNCYLNLPDIKNTAFYNGLMKAFVENNGKVRLSDLKPFTFKEEKKKPKLKKSNNENKKKLSEIQLAYRDMAFEFYRSFEWRSLRYKVLSDNGGKCCLCGRSRKDGVILHVDHIIPLSKNWSKRLDINNLQVLCEDCNMGKSNKDNIDWR